MESSILIGESVYWIGSNDRETDLFEGLWPLPKGVAYNSYLILDQKTALIDTVKAFTAAGFLSRLQERLGTERELDYLVVNHVEPDHSGALKLVLQRYPKLQIVGNKKTAEFLAHLCGITQNVRVVDDGEPLSLGSKTLRFFLVPMVHWPETMVTYEEQGKILFSCDAFGAFGAHDGSIFDDTMEVDRAEDEMLRYYSNIVGKYSVMVQKALSKLGALQINIIAPSHGPIWRGNPAKVIGRYDRWSRHLAEPGVVVVYGSMYGHSRKMAEAVAEGLGEGGEKRMILHDVSRTHPSYLLRDAWKYQALVLGAPAYDTRLYPPMAHLVDLFERKQLKNRLLGVFGTFGWSGGGVSALKEFAQKVGWELLEPVVEARFCPNDDHLQSCRFLGKTIAQKLAR